MTQPQQSTLARKMVLEVNTNTVASPVWTTVKGLNEYTWTPGDPNLEDDNVYEDLGYTGQTKTALSVKAEGKVMRRTLPTDVTTYDPGQEKLRTLSNLLGPTGVGYFRTYDRDGGPEAYTFFAEVSWQPEGGGPTDLEAVSFTLTGKGAPTLITNPNAPALALPTVTSVLSAAGAPGGTTAGGTLVTIRGDNFKDRNGTTVVTGATGVKFGANNATSYIVLDRQTITAITPAGAAATVQTIVTNTTGASANTSGDDYTYA
jgi:hypothetical protein